eukprot:s5181_g6.t1
MSTAELWHRSHFGPNSIQVAYHSPSMTLETFLFSFVFGFLVYGGPACDTYVCDDSHLLQRANAGRAERYGTWAFPRDWKTNRDIANVSDFDPITWGSVENQDVLLNFLSAIPVFGEGGNYIALLHGMDHHLAKQLRYLETGELSLFCSGPNGSHRTKVRGLGNETSTAYKIHFVFLCDWPEEDKHLERFEVFLEDGHGKQLGTVVAEQKNGLLQQYRTADKVHSIAFNLYRFAQVQPGQVELSSVLREPSLQRGCPKYVLNANNVNTVFIHWVTSWKNGTQGLAVVDKDMLVAHHYREPRTRIPQGPATSPSVEANTTDASMQQYVPILSRSLAARFLEETPGFLSRLSAVKPVPFPTSNLRGAGLEIEEGLQAMDPACLAWIKSFSKLKGIASLDPPIDPFIR